MMKPNALCVETNALERALIQSFTRQDSIKAMKVKIKLTMQIMIVGEGGANHATTQYVLPLLPDFSSSAGMKTSSAWAVVFEKREAMVVKASIIQVARRDV